jgi:hypothetical protein
MQFGRDQNTKEEECRVTTREKNRNTCDSKKNMNSIDAYLHEQRIRWRTTLVLVIALTDEALVGDFWRTSQYQWRDWIYNDVLLYAI